MIQSQMCFEKDHSGFNVCGIYIVYIVYIHNECIYTIYTMSEGAECQGHRAQLDYGWKHGNVEKFNIKLIAIAGALYVLPEPIQPASEATCK